MAWLIEPLGNQPLQLTSHKQIDDEAAQRKSEESSERHSGALLGGYREVSACLCTLKGAGAGGNGINRRFGECMVGSNATACTLLLTIPAHVRPSLCRQLDCCQGNHG